MCTPVIQALFWKRANEIADLESRALKRLKDSSSATCSKDVLDQKSANDSRLFYWCDRILRDLATQIHGAYQPGWDRCKQSFQEAEGSLLEQFEWPA